MLLYLNLLFYFPGLNLFNRYVIKALSNTKNQQVISSDIFLDFYFFSGTVCSGASTISVSPNRYHSRQNRLVKRIAQFMIAHTNVTTRHATFPH